MNQYTMNVLEFNKVIEIIKTYALSDQAVKMIEERKPSTNLKMIQTWMNETTEAVAILDVNASIPLISMAGVEECLTKAEKAMVLTPEELCACQNLLEAVKRIKKYMAGMQTAGPVISSYAWSMYELEELRNSICQSIVNGQVDDRASHELSRIRKKILVLEDKIKQKLNDILRSPKYKDLLQETLISSRNGRYVVPVRRKEMKKFPGQVLDMSSTGSTVFMEPEVITKLQEELDLLRIEEKNEVYRILTELSDQVAGYRQELSLDMEVIANYDFIFARAKYSRSMNMKPVQLNRSGQIDIRQGKHPLLGLDAVPLNFQIGKDFRALIITGPNTGGKTIALKTVGLLTLMAQCGFHVPVAEGSQIAVFTNILSDIGDGQSIEQSLSTFSAHVKNIQMIIQICDESTLVIMDEMGAGTDPGEGHGFAIAVLEEIFAKGATIIATTHFGELKEYALNTPGFENGCMAFDSQTLQPLYELQIGNWGNSNAFHVALRLGIEKHVIERAHEITYGEKVKYDLINPATESILNQDDLKAEIEIKRQTIQDDQIRQKQERNRQFIRKNLKVGDRVYISTMQRSGIVYEEENSRGELVVLVMGKKYVINQKRLVLEIDREELYPENYDMDILFESKENRKKKKIMSKKHVEGLMIEKEKE